MLDLSRMRSHGEMLLVTTDDWFSGGVWGLCKVVEAKEIFGFKPSGNANWYLQVGTGEDAVFVAGCRVHYAQICLTKPGAKDILCVGVK